MLQLSSSLEENLAALNARFGASADFYAKRIELYHCPGAIVLFDNMASLQSLWSLLLDAATRHTPSLEPERMPHSGMQVYDLLMNHSGLPAEDGPVKDMDDLIRRMTAGMAVLLLDGCKKGLVFSVQGLKSRSVEEPSGEGNLRGSREGFADLLRVNLSLLRRLIRTDTLVMETAQADCAMKTEYAICYCKDKAGKTAVARVRRTLREAKPEVLLDSSYFVPWLFPARWRLFAPVSYTERPASAAAKLCEGKIVILVNGSPSALVLPSLFCENFDCLDDYATTAVFSSFLRVLKYGSFISASSCRAFCLSGGLSARAHPTAVIIQNRGSRKGDASAALCRDAAGHHLVGDHPGGRASDAPDAGPLGEPCGSAHHR